MRETSPAERGFFLFVLLHTYEKKKHLRRPHLQDVQALSTGPVWKAPPLRRPPGLRLSRLRGEDEPCEGRRGGGTAAARERSPHASGTAGRREGQPGEPLAPTAAPGDSFPAPGSRGSARTAGPPRLTGQAAVTGSRRGAGGPGGRRGGYSHGEVIHEALPARGPLQEVVDPALDAAAAQQGLAEAVDGDAGVEADGGPRTVGVHHHHLALQAQRPLRLRAAARRRLPALGGGERGVVGVGGALGQLQRRGLLTGRHAAFPGQRQPAQAPAFLLARG